MRCPPKEETSEEVIYQVIVRFFIPAFIIGGIASGLYQIYKAVHP